MIQVTVKPRADNRFDIYVHAKNGELLLNSSQGYENVEDAEAVARRCFSSIDHDASTKEGVAMPNVPVQLTVEYRTGDVKAERIR